MRTYLRYLIALLLPLVAQAQDTTIADYTDQPTPASGDLLYLLDVDDLSDGVDGSNKKLTIANLKTAINPGFGADAYSQITPTNAIVLDEATGNEVALTLDYTVNKATSGNDTGLKINMTDTASPGTSLLADFQVGGVSQFKVDKFGALILGPSITTDWVSSGVRIGNRYGSPTLQNGTALLNFGSTGDVNIDGSDPSYQISGVTKLYSDAAGILAQRNGTNDQEFRIYNTRTSASNGEWLELGFQDTANTAVIKTNANGSGLVRNLSIDAPLSVTKNIGLPTTSSTAGAININSLRFMHGYGTRGTFLGEESGNFTLTGSSNTGIGNIALKLLTTGNSNTAVGYGSQYNNLSGTSNASVGANALYANQGSNYNAAFGVSALHNTTSTGNTATGYSALYGNTSGTYNAAIGYQAGRYITDGATANATGTYSVFVGTDTKAAANGETNQIVIGYNAIGAGSNSVVLGNDSVTTTLLKGSVGVGAGITAPSSALDVDGTVETKIYTVSALPSAATAGQMAFVSDSSVAHAGNSGAVVAGGSTNFVPVYSDGTDWRIH